MCIFVCKRYRLCVCNTIKFFCSGNGRGKRLDRTRSCLFRKKASRFGSSSSCRFCACRLRKFVRTEHSTVTKHFVFTAVCTAVLTCVTAYCTYATESTLIVNRQGVELSVRKKLVNRKNLCKFFFTDNAHKACKTRSLIFVNKCMIECCKESL